MYGMVWYLRLYICNNPASVANIPQRTDNNPSPAQERLAVLPRDG